MVFKNFCVKCLIDVIFLDEVSTLHIYQMFELTNNLHLEAMLVHLHAIYVCMIHHLLYAC